MSEIKARKFTIDVSGPVKDEIFDVALFEKYLLDRIKVQGRVGNLSQSVLVKTADSIVSVTVAPNVVFAKRYLKYLTKKVFVLIQFLKKNQLRDWLRVVASAKSSYELRYYNVSSEDKE